MDTSETYIKMCEKATEIQTSQQDMGFIHGDYYYEPASRNWDIIYDSHKSYVYGIPLCIWLPRQDQLQEMLSLHNLWAKTLAFEFFLRKEGSYDIKSYAFQFTSMEQLWLAFVMKEKYNKVWNGEDWVKEIE